MVHAHDIVSWLSGIPTKWSSSLISSNQFEWPMDVKISLLASEFGHMLLKTIKSIE